MSTFARLLTTACIVPFVVSMATSGPLITHRVYVATDGNDANTGRNILQPKLTITSAIGEAVAGDTVVIGEGTFTEHVNIYSGITVMGSGTELTTVQAPMTGTNRCIYLSAENVILQGVKIVRMGNNVDDWGQNTSEMGIQVSNCTTAVVQDCYVEGFDRGIDISTSVGVDIRRNVFAHNGFGIRLSNRMEALSIHNNEITDNWYTGVFIHELNANNHDIDIVDNNISRNWCGQILSLALGTVPYTNFSRNYLGSTEVTFELEGPVFPTFSIPEYFGGTGTSPGLYEGYISGRGNDSMDITPWLGFGDDDSYAEGWQPSYDELYVGAMGIQSGSVGRISEAVGLATNDATIYVNDGTYTENVVIDKELAMYSMNGASVTTIDGVNGRPELGTVMFTDTASGAYFGGMGVGFTVLGLNGMAADTVKAGIYFAGPSLSNIRIVDNIITARGDAGIYGQKHQPISGIEIEGNTIDGTTFIDDPAGDGLSAQYTLDNVPRPLVSFANNPDSTYATDFLFSQNIVSGTTGDFSYTDDSGLSVSEHPQGNHLVELDLGGVNTIGQNLFFGTTMGDSIAALSARGKGSNSITDNEFAGGGFSLHFSSAMADTNKGKVRAQLVYDNNATGNASRSVNSYVVATTIAGGIASARVADTVLVKSGQYYEEPVIDKRLTLLGNGADTTGTVLVGTLRIDASGVSNSTPTVVTEMRIVGSYGSGVTVAGGRNHILVHNMNITHHMGNAVHIEGSGPATDLVFRDCYVAYNSGVAYLLDEYIDLDSLSIIDGEIAYNAEGGFVYNVGEDATSLNHVLIQNINFQENGMSEYAFGGDILFNGFNGNVRLDNVGIYGTYDTTLAPNGVSFRGATSTQSAGVIDLHALSIQGTYIEAGIKISNYSAVENISFDTVMVNVENSRALMVAGISGTLTLSASTELASCSCAQYIYCDLTDDNNVDGIVDATMARIGYIELNEASLTELFDMTDHITDRLDDYSPENKRALVLMRDDNLYMTENSKLSSCDPTLIQRALDAATPGTTIHLRAGDYGRQIATDRFLVDGGGPFQFGLFVGTDSVSVVGYTDSDDTVSSADSVWVNFTTNGTNLFDVTGVFVQGSDFHLRGVAIGDNYDNNGDISNDKTIEVIANGFDLGYSRLSTDNTVNGGSVYFGEWTQARFDSGTVRSYDIHDNRFDNVMVSVNNGVGTQGSRDNRLIRDNMFSGSFYPSIDPSPAFQYYIAFRGWYGADPAQIWITHPVGGAVISGNTFSDEIENIVVARGNDGGYNASEINFRDIWNYNVFGRRVVTLSDEGDFDLRSFNSNGYTNSRGIVSSITAGLGRAECNDVVLVGQDTYYESPVFDRCTTVVVKAENGSTVLADTNYFVFGTHGLGDANFSNWTDATFDELGVNTSGSIQEAANFVNPFGTVLLQSGIYTVTTPVSLDSGITLKGTGTGSGCSFVPTTTIACTTNVRTFDVPSTENVKVENLSLNIGTGSNNRFFRLTSTGNVIADEVSFLRNGVRLYGTNASSTQTDKDIPKFIDDGNDVGFGPGTVAFGAGSYMPTAHVNAGWRGEDANALTISSVTDNSGNGNPLVQTSVLRKPTRTLVDSNYVISTSVTKYVAASLTSNIQGGGARSLFVVFKTSGAIANGVVYKQGDQTDGISVWTKTGNQAGINVTIGGLTTVYHSFTVAINTWYMAQVYFDGSSTDHRVGMVMHGVPTDSAFYWNSTAVSATTLTTPTNVNAVVSAGARQGYTRMDNAALTSNTLGDAFIGSIGEVVVLNTADASTRDQAYCVLSNKWKVGTSPSNPLQKDEIEPVFTGGALEAQITAAYPNPATDEVSFSVVPVATEELRISIVNTMGTEVATVYSGMAAGGMELPITADVSHLANGAYMIVVSGANTHFSMPVMKQR